jgi:hypothetical protein
MKAAEFVKNLIGKSTGRTTIEANEDMAERIFTGLKHIAMRTTPLTLLVDNTFGHQILRRLDEDAYIRMPVKPIIMEDDDIDIDDALLDALSYFVMAGLEPQKGKTNRGFYWAEIEMNNQRLIETYLEDDDDAGQIGNQFP